MMRMRKTKDLHRDRWRHLESKKITQIKDSRWGHILGMKIKWMNDIGETKDLYRGKWGTSWEKNNTDKKLKWGHIFGVKKIIEYV